MKNTLVAILALCLAGCGTKYQEVGLTGGVQAEQITADTYRIVSRGNGYTSATTIQDYTLLKAAETTIAAGGTHFVIVSAADASRTQTIVTPGSATTNVYGNTAITTYNPGMAGTMIKPGQDTYIRVLKLQPGQQAGGAILAAEIVQFVGPRVQRG